MTRVAVSLFNQHDEIAANEETLIPQAPTPIIFQVPQNAANASYRIYIRGTLLNGDVVFYNETSVIFHPKSLSIFVQLDRPMYRHDQTGDAKNLFEPQRNSLDVLVHFRCIPVYSDLRGYFSTMNVYVIVNRNIELRWEIFSRTFRDRWIISYDVGIISRRRGVGTKYVKNFPRRLFLLIGYVELSYRFASFIAFGTYTIRCEAQQSSSEKTFLVDFFRKNLPSLFQYL